MRLARLSGRGRCAEKCRTVNREDSAIAAIIIALLTQISKSASGKSRNYSI